jgi:xylulokinase
MSIHLGIDLGTSSVRAAAVDDHGVVHGEGRGTYPITGAGPGVAEQDPDEWWTATVAAVRAALRDVPREQVVSIGLTGQMHGVALTDAAGSPVRPAIIWPDQRTASDADALRDACGDAWVQQRAGMPPAAGMLGLSLGWLSRHEPEALARARWALLPKDHLRMRLVGDAATDPSDASGTLLFDVAVGAWSGELIDAMGIDAELLPPVRASDEVAGGLRAAAAEALGLTAGIPVAVGAADQATAALSLGLGTLSDLAVGISSGGTVLAPLAAPRIDVGRGVHTMTAADGGWLRMGAILSAGLALDWVARIVDPTGERGLARVVAGAGEVAPGAEGVVFLPYLRGERTPVLDATATASFRHLRMDHQSPVLVRAVLEGVAYALRDAAEAAAPDGVRGLRITGFGGGLRSPVWRQIMADVLGAPVRTSTREEHSVFGAAMLGALASGSTIAADDQQITVTEPDPEAVARYADGTARYHRDRDRELGRDG